MFKLYLKYLKFLADENRASLKREVAAKKRALSAFTMEHVPPRASQMTSHEQETKLQHIYNVACSLDISVCWILCFAFGVNV